MTKIQSEVIGVRLTPSAVEALRAFAERRGMRNKAGDLNLSEAARTIIALALSQGVPETIYAAAMENARSEWLERVNGAWREAMKAITQVGLG